MDPQHRLILEAAGEALAAAAPHHSVSAAKTGVFVGISWTEHARLAGEAGMPVSAYTAQVCKSTGCSAAVHVRAAVPAHVWTVAVVHDVSGLSPPLFLAYIQGAVLSVCPGRVAFHHGLKGPAVAVDTACSSSLVATLSAREAALGSGGAALAGGINMMLAAATTFMFKRAGMLSGGVDHGWRLALLPLPPPTLLTLQLSPFQNRTRAHVACAGPVAITFLRSRWPLQGAGGLCRCSCTKLPFSISTTP